MNGSFCGEHLVEKGSRDEKSTSAAYSTNQSDGTDVLQVNLCKNNGGKWKAQSLNNETGRKTVCYSNVFENEGH